MLLVFNYVCKIHSVSQRLVVLGNYLVLTSLKMIGPNNNIICIFFEKIKLFQLKQYWNFHANNLGIINFKEQISEVIITVECRRDCH